MAEALHEVTADRDALRAIVRATLTRISQTGALPALPGVATAALGIARDPDAEVDELTNVMQTDVGLSARVLRVANSPHYGRRRQARSIQEAVLTVGLHQTCDILVAVCAKQLYTSPGPYSEILWNHALAVAVASEELAKSTRLVRPGTAFLPGLFHDIGRTAFLLADEPSFAALQDLVAAGEGEGAAIEREWYEFDHAQAGGILAEDWGLAADQTDAIRWHHDPTRAEAGRDLATVINAADHLAYTLGYGIQQEPPSDVSIASLDLGNEDTPSLIERVREAFEAHKQLLG